MGRLTLTELAYLLITRREPTDGADAGSSTRCSCRSPTTGSRRARSRPGSRTPARPRRRRAAIAAGLLGAGSVFLGPAGDTAQFLAGRACRQRRRRTRRRHARATLAEAAVRRAGDAGERVPGLGHPVHKDAGPAHAAPLRARRGRKGCSGRTSACSRFVADVHDDAVGPAPADQRRRRGRRRARRHRHPADERARRRAHRAHRRPRRPPRRRGRRPDRHAALARGRRPRPRRATDATLEVSLPIFSR